ncbi:hypothetical protein [Clostridium sp.]|uniref:hypothetical protein n=1 Tax=Clostridium sp. TaxID=1506 RepID=UPI002843ED72|nr:hypothetical protein [Clostridium sp.]MDR3595210.1 hypothetical protein [Clostridium sp.]
MRMGETEIAIIDVITFTGIMITFITGVLNLCQNKKSLYINNITKFRVIWISTFRGHIASLKELSNITNLYIITKNETNKIAYRRELEKVVSLIKMHLNFTGKYDIQLISKVEKLKATINSYLLMHYCKNSIKLVNDDLELLKKFDEIVNAISEKQVLEQLLNLAVNNKNINTNTIKLFDLKREVKSAYMNNSELIKKIIKESDHIISKYESEIDCLNNEIDVIVQIYLKAEWIRCKVETRIWPYNRYNEEKMINKLQKKYKEQSKK